MHPWRSQALILPNRRASLTLAPESISAVSVLGFVQHWLQAVANLEAIGLPKSGPYSFSVAKWQSLLNWSESVSQVANFICYFYGHWALASEPCFEAHRRMTAAEMARLQGFQSGDVAWKAAATPITSRGHQVGNSMSVPVLQEAIRAVLSAAGLMWVSVNFIYYFSVNFNVESYPIYCQCQCQCQSNLAEG